MKALILGGGKIARGFVGQLLYRSGFEMTFADINRKLVDALNDAGKYYVNVMGSEKESQWITGFHCISITDIPAIAESLKEADIAFTSVGGKNLDSVALTLAAAYEQSGGRDGKKPLTIVTCENWKDPARKLKKAIEEALPSDGLRAAFEREIGITEAVIMRSGVEAAQEVLAIDTNAVSVTNFWELPIDIDRFKGEPILFEGVQYRGHFEHFLQQKVYTFNTTNATIAYLARIRGIEDLAQAANDPEILDLVRQVHAEINPAIAAEMGVSLEEQQAFSLKALHKYQDRSVTDYTERHARDPWRKLGPEDRIVGTLRLVEKHGGSGEALATTLAAALYYPVTNPEDPTAEKLRKLRKEEGVDAVLEQVCHIGKEEKLACTIHERIEYLRSAGWLKKEEPNG